MIQRLFAVGGWAWLAVAVIAVGSVARGDDAVRIVPREGITNFFGGDELKLHFEIASDEAFEGLSRWTLSAAGRTLASREAAISLRPDKPADVEVRYTLPPVKEGVIFPLLLQLTVGVPKDEKPHGEYQEPLYLFAQNPFLDRKKWLESLKLHLFDPEEATAKALDALEVPYTRITNLETLTDMDQGLVIVAEGTNWNNYGDLGKSLLAAAVRGVTVVALPPAAGKLPASFLSDPAAARILLRRRDVIRELDKRFSLAWSVDRAVETSDLIFQFENGEMMAGAAEPGKGWPWIDVQFRKPNARFIWCGFGLLASWKESPTPRYFLARLLEVLTPEDLKSPLP